MQRKNLQSGVLLMGAALLATGCKVGPNYKTPAMPAPPAYSDNGQNGNWTAAQPMDAQPRGDWWLVYHDAELNTLEQQCATANQNLIAALHAYEAAHDIFRENKALLYPTISIGGSGSRNRVSDYKPLRPSGQANDYWDFLVPLNIAWEPDLWGGIRRQIESSAANAQASAADLANAKLSLQGELAVTYFQIRGVDLQAKLLRDSITAYEESLRLTRARFQGGVASESDVAQSTALLEGTRAQLVDLAAMRAVMVDAIAVLSGAPATGFAVTEQPLAGDPPSVPTGVPSALLQRRPDIAVAERRVAAANAQIGVLKAQYYPTVTLGAMGGVESDLVSKVFSPGAAMWSAGPNVNQIIFDAGRRKAQVAQAVAEREQAAAVYRQSVLTAFRDVEDQLATLRTLQEEAVVQDRAVAAARRSTELSTIRYKGGLAQYLEVLTNQTIELQDERQAASLVTRRIVASAQLQMALGGGWDAAQLPKN